MCEAIPPFPNAPSWRGAQLKHRDSVTVYLYVVCESSKRYSTEHVTRLMNPIRVSAQTLATLTELPFLFV
jgi:hypothetical protein